MTVKKSRAHDGTPQKFFSSILPRDQVSKHDQHPTRKELVSRRGVGELVGCSASTVQRLETQGAITRALVDEVRGAEGCVRHCWYRRADTIALRALRQETNPQRVDMTRSAAMWMLRIQEVTYRKIGEAFGVSASRAREIIERYERTLRARARTAEAWLIDQSARRQAKGTTP